MISFLSQNIRAVCSRNAGAKRRTMFYYDFYGFDFMYIDPDPRRVVYRDRKAHAYPYIPKYMNTGYHVRAPTGAGADY